MYRKFFFISFAAAALLLLCNVAASAQVGELRGRVVRLQPDGTKAGAPDAVIDVYRTDLGSGKPYTTKTDKRGNFVFAGLPYVGTYAIAASAPNARPEVIPSVKVGQGTEYEVVLSPGDGKRLTAEEMRSMASNASNATVSSGGSSAETKAKNEELVRKNNEILSKNKRIEEGNAIVERTYKAAGAAIDAKQYDAAITQLDEGLAVEEHPALPILMTAKAVALKARGVDRYNASVRETNDAAKTSGLEAARKDFREAAEISTKAVQLFKAQTPPTEPAALTSFNFNKLQALATRAEAMRLFVTKVDQSQADAGVAAFQEYIAAETDPAKKSKAQLDEAQMLFDAGVMDKALAEYQKILVTTPDDPDALVYSGIALFNIGAATSDKAKYQEAANYLQRFVDKAPDTHKFKADAKALLEEIKNQQNIKPEKPAGRSAGGRRRP